MDKKCRKTHKKVQNIRKSKKKKGKTSVKDFKNKIKL